LKQKQDTRDDDEDIQSTEPVMMKRHRGRKLRGIGPLCVIAKARALLSYT
jgi:hypothetical protein